MKKYCSLLVLIVLFFVDCNSDKNKTVVIDTTMADSIIESAVVKVGLPDTTRLLLDRLDIIMRCRDLDDSAQNIYIQYAEGHNTYKHYLKARKAYLKEYDSVYVPLCNKLGLKPEGGKK